MYIIFSEGAVFVYVYTKVLDVHVLMAIKKDKGCFHELPAFILYWYYYERQSYDQTNLEIMLIFEIFHIAILRISKRDFPTYITINYIYIIKG